jgi:hypothetical protein
MTEVSKCEVLDISKSKKELIKHLITKINRD